MTIVPVIVEHYAGMREAPSKTGQHEKNVANVRYTAVDWRGGEENLAGLGLGIGTGDW